MAKIRTLSRTFPAGHPKAGQYTYFVEKFLKCLYKFDNLEQLSDRIFAVNKHRIESGVISAVQVCRFCNDIDFGVYKSCDPKHHTIRSGHSIKDGEAISVRCWSGKPYNSPQIILAPDIAVRVAPINIKEEEQFFPFKLDIQIYNGVIIGEYLLAKNDGLLKQDFIEWFKPSLPFQGQVIIWSKENIGY